MQLLWGRKPELQTSHPVCGAQLMTDEPAQQARMGAMQQHACNSENTAEQARTLTNYLINKQQTPKVDDIYSCED